jgi:O-antigen/teichoic acid export membrane protein
MSRKKLFIENMLSYGFINILNKIVPFLLLPVITSMLPNASDFGIYSMYGTIVGLGTPLVMMGLSDAIFREYFAREDAQYRLDILKTANGLILITSLVVCVTLLLLSKIFSEFIFDSASYSSVIILSSITIFIGANSAVIQAPSRLQNHRKVFMYSGIISSVIMYGMSLWLVFRGLSYNGLIYANLMTTLVLVIFFWIRNRNFINEGHFRTSTAMALLKIGIPLVPTVLIYWVFNSMDRIMILKLLGSNDLGVYSVGSKIAQLSQLIYTGFAGGYGYFKYKTMNDSDQIKMNSKLFEILTVVSFLSFIIVSPFVKLFYDILFKYPYEEGYIVVAHLFLCPLLLMMYQVISTQFVIVKKSYISSLTLAIGAIINIGFNYLFIPVLGIEGASISTVIGYFASICMVIIFALRYKLLEINARIIKLSIILLLNLVVPRIFFHNQIIVNIFIAAFSIAVIALIYKNEMISTFSDIKLKKK